MNEQTWLIKMFTQAQHSKERNLSDIMLVKLMLLTKQEMSVNEPQPPDHE